jgi:hypothetical protein
MQFASTSCAPAVSHAEPQSTSTASGLNHAQMPGRRVTTTRRSIRALHTLQTLLLELPSRAAAPQE